MRIIAGEARGRRLFAPEGTETRPTADRVREALFNIIRADVPDAAVLDVFAGSGALALEAISRGAARATLIDRSPRAAAVIRRNIELMRAGDKAQLIAGDWRAALPRLKGGYTLVFLDPPYAQVDAYPLVTGALIAAGQLADGALIVMEHSADHRIDGLDRSLEITDRRAYRDTALTLARYSSKGGEAG